MTTQIQLKRSSTVGSIPTASDLEFGELAVNTRDGKLFFKHLDSNGAEQIVSIVEDKEDNFLIDSSGLTYSSSNTLKNVLDDLDATIITKADFSATTNTASGTGDLAYNNATGAFSFTPPVVPTSITNLGISDGQSGQFLQTDGAGSFSFASVANPLTVKKINSNNTALTTVNNVTDIRFDTDSGFDVTDLGSGAVKIQMNSTFKTWKVSGETDLVATCLYIIEIVAGSGIEILTNPTGSTYKQLTINNTRFGTGSGGGAIGVIIDISIADDGDMLLHHVDTFNSDNAKINSNGEFILTDE